MPFSFSGSSLSPSKRITWWPQIFLGLAFNWGVLVGYAASLEKIINSSFLYVFCMHILDTFL